MNMLFLISDLRHLCHPCTSSDYACGTVFAVDHALSYPKLPSLCHNAIRGLTANLLTEVYHQVQVEPELQVVSDPGAFFQATANI